MVMSLRITVELIREAERLQLRFQVAKCSARSWSLTRSPSNWCFFFPRFLVGRIRDTKIDSKKLVPTYSKLKNSGGPS